MRFTKKQAGITGAIISVIIGIIGAPMAGIACAIGFFILLTA